MSSGVAPTKSPAKVPRNDPDTQGRATAAWVGDAGLIVGFLALTFLLGMFPLRDTDFWWHLKAGDQIRQSWQVPTEDTFTYGAEGHRWVDLHWGFQVLTSWGYAHGGVPFLTLAKCAITTLAVFLLITARRKDWPVWAMLLAWLPAILVLSARMYIRPETLTLLYMATDLAILSRLDRRPGLAFALPIVQFFWVNSHGLFILGPILIASALVDAALSRGAFEVSRRGWWRKVLIGSVLAALACLVNPYGVAGAVYPLQLAETMRNPVFQSIQELRSIPTLIGDVGFDSLLLDIHLLTMVLGALSFLAPMAWSGWVAVQARSARSKEDQADKPAKKKTRKSAKLSRDDTTTSWRLSPFRLLLYIAFSFLGLSANRNSHQFAAVVGTITAWNVGEWLAAMRNRKNRLTGRVLPPRSWPKWVAFAAIASTFVAVASGQFYTWAGEGRTIGLGEEPLWFPHDAVKRAGLPGMPDRLIAFHNGHPTLYEYEYAPARKVYTDARLEVMGADLYTHYLNLEDRMAQDTGAWADEVNGMGRPAVLLDNVQILGDSREIAATLMTSGRWTCVWFDPIASVFVHDSYTDVVRKYGVDFLARHYRPDPSSKDEATLAATARACRTMATALMEKQSGRAWSEAFILLGLDQARHLREIDPGNLDGWKQAGLLESFRDPTLGAVVSPRYRLPFDPVLDLSIVRASYQLSRAIELAPGDGACLRTLGLLDTFRGLNEAAVPVLEAFARVSNTSKRQQEEKAKVAEQVVALKAKLGPIPDLKWANLSELYRLISVLLATGRAATAAEVIDGAFRAEARPWEWSDRLAVLRLHLGQPAKARSAWMGSASDHAALRAARIAATYLVEGNFEEARKSYREAIRLDPALFEAHYGLALLEQDDGKAAAALAEANLAEKLAPNNYSRIAARSIAVTASPYASTPAVIPQR